MQAQSELDRARAAHEAARKQETETLTRLSTRAGRSNLAGAGRSNLAGWRWVVGLSQAKKAQQYRESVIRNLEQKVRMLSTVPRADTAARSTGPPQRGPGLIEAKAYVDFFFRVVFVFKCNFHDSAGRWLFAAKANFTVEDEHGSHPAFLYRDDKNTRAFVGIANSKTTSGTPLFVAEMNDTDTNGYFGERPVPIVNAVANYTPNRNGRLRRAETDSIGQRSLASFCGLSDGEHSG